MSRINIANLKNFYSEKLEAQHFQVYADCVGNLLQGKLRTVVTLEMTEKNRQAAESVVEAIVYGCPELFFIEQEVRTSWSGNQLTLDFKNKYPKENIGELWEKLNAETDRICAIINKFQTVYDKLNRLNDYLCARVKPVSSFERSELGDAYGALILKQARCEGFAKAAKLILDRCGIPSLIAKGEADSGCRREPHAWNIAACGDAFYHFDFTWNAGYAAHGIPGADYMFLDDRDCGLQHFPDHKYPACTDEGKTFWAVNNGILKYHSDLSRIRLVPFDRNYMAAAKLPRKLSQYEYENEVFGWMVNELSAHSYASTFSYRYNQVFQVLFFYFING